MFLETDGLAVNAKRMERIEAGFWGRGTRDEGRGETRAGEISNFRTRSAYYRFAAPDDVGDSASPPGQK